jgi:hypothetical protein
MLAVAGLGKLAPAAEHSLQEKPIEAQQNQHLG